MNLEEEILQKYSAEHALKIAEYIGADEDLFAELMALFLKGNYRLTQRSAWILSKCASNYPFLVKPYMAAMLEKLKENDIHDAVKRNIVRIWEDVELPEALLGEIFDICLKFLLSSHEPFAIKAFSMSVLNRIAQQIPELKPELRYAIEDQMMKFPDSGAVQSRGKKILKSL